MRKREWAAPTPTRRPRFMLDPHDREGSGSATRLWRGVVRDGTLGDLEVFVRKSVAVAVFSSFIALRHHCRLQRAVPRRELVEPRAGLEKQQRRCRREHVEQQRQRRRLHESREGRRPPCLRPVRARQLLRVVLTCDKTRIAGGCSSASTSAPATSFVSSRARVPTRRAAASSPTCLRVRSRSARASALPRRRTRAISSATRSEHERAQPLVGDARRDRRDARSGAALPRRRLSLRRGWHGGTPSQRLAVVTARAQRPRHRPSHRDA